MFKKSLLIISSISLLNACVTVPNTGGNSAQTGQQIVDGAIADIKNVAAKTTSSSSETKSAGKEVTHNATYRAMSAFNDGSGFKKVDGHEIKASYGKEEEGTEFNVTKFTNKAQSFDGVLTSVDKKTVVESSEVTLSSADLAKLNQLRKDIDQINTDLGNSKSAAQINQLQSDLNSKFSELKNLIGDSKVVMDHKSIAGSGNADFGWFIAKGNGDDYRQISAIYAIKDGVSVADYNSMAKVTANYATNFKGGAIVNGNFIELIGQGNIEVDFNQNQLNAVFDKVHNSSNTESGKLTFSGSTGAQSDGTMFKNSSNVQFIATKGSLKSSVSGSAEAALVAGGDSIVGAVRFVDGDQAIAGGFGGDKK